MINLLKQLVREQGPMSHCSQVDVVLPMPFLASYNTRANIYETVIKLLLGHFLAVCDFKSSYMTI